jgi:kynurenine 3-monooxygenase
MPSINIIGGGLAGSLLSVLLAQRGFGVEVFERRADMRKQQTEGGRSINLALSQRGLTALREAGLEEDILSFSVPMYGRMLHDRVGGTQFQPYSRDGKECIYSVSRAGLNMRLMDYAEPLKRVDYHFQQICEGADLGSGAVHLRDLPSGRRYDAPGEVSVACDGAFSAIRYQMQKLPRFNFSQEYENYGYKELTIPPGPGGSFQLDPGALHIWPRETFMLIALPNPDGSFTCTLFLAYEGEASFARLGSPEAVEAFFEAYFPDAAALIPDLAAEFAENPTGSLLTIRCYPWALGGKIALLGDAAHAIVPFFGQGMNAAFEDCRVLAACIDQHYPDWGSVFGAYEQSRKANADAIAQMALENFIEMRDRVADPDFQFRKKIEHQLGQHFPQYRSRYEWVSFSNLPYAEALARGQQNDAIVDQLIAGRERPEDLDWAAAARLVEAAYGPGSEI